MRFVIFIPVTFQEELLFLDFCIILYFKLNLNPNLNQILTLIPILILTLSLIQTLES
jgi:hypothetical protein